jgi:phosphonate transport system ATP-binding protein
VSAAPAAAVRMQGVWAGYAPGSPALRGVSMEVAPGERRVVVGPSGSGKSTLLKVLAGLIRPSAGEVRVLGATTGTRRRGAQQIGYVPQNVGLVATATVLQNVMLGALARTSAIRSALGSFPPEEYENAAEALASTGLAHLADRRAHELSGGERRRLAVARALVQRPALLLADEFLSELDDLTAERVLGALDRARARLGMTIVMVEHNLRVACDFADRVTVLGAGEVVADAPSSEMDPSTLRGLLCPVAVA